MTLNEAIKHCAEKVDCTACGKEHAQLRDWLLELRDLRNRKTGRWEQLGEKLPYRLKCSECDWDVPQYGKFYSFCPNCGADMRGELE